jgi:hypothetical protein
MMGPTICVPLFIDTQRGLLKRVKTDSKSICICKKMHYWVTVHAKKLSNKQGKELGFLHTRREMSQWLTSLIRRNTVQSVSSQ